MTSDAFLNKNQQIIMHAFHAFPIHPTAEQIYGLVRQTYPRFNLSSVYRSLKQLEKMGKLRRIIGLEERNHYDHRLDEHAHFICVKCGCVLDVPANFCSCNQEELEQKMGISFEKMELNIHGVCSECQKK